VGWLGEGSFEPCAEMAAFKAARPSHKIATGGGISLAQIERLTIFKPDQRRLFWSCASREAESQVIIGQE
jgi:hypothetical protein